MIKNSYDNLYIGVTDDPERRIKEHNSKRGSDFTKIRDEFRIVFLEEYENLADARKREIQIKKWKRDKKDKLIDMYKNGLETKLKKIW